MTTEKATNRQTWAIFCLSKFDVRNCGLTKEQASKIIDLLKTNLKAGIAEIEKLPGAVKRGNANQSAILDFAKIFEEARKAGLTAGEKATPAIMVVEQRANPLDDKSPVEKRWVVPEGPCGFAWVTVKPGNSAFARWLVKHDLASKSYYGGVDIWVYDFNQSVDRKSAYAYAFAETLRKHGIKAFASSRLD